MNEKLNLLRDQSWILYCRLSSALEHHVFSETNKTSPLFAQRLKRLELACHRAYARFERRTDALY